MPERAAAETVARAARDAAAGVAEDHPEVIEDWWARVIFDSIAMAAVEGRPTERTRADGAQRGGHAPSVKDMAIGPESTGCRRAGRTSPGVAEARGRAPTGCDKRHSRRGKDGHGD